MVLTAGDRILVHTQPPKLYAKRHVLPDRKQAEAGGPDTQLCSAVLCHAQLTSTTAPLYFAPGLSLGVGVVSLSIVYRVYAVVNIVYLRDSAHDPSVNEMESHAGPWRACNGRVR
jgi:hypothetical protein